MGDDYYSLIRFNLGGLPSSSPSVQLYLYAYPRGDASTPVSMYLDRVTGPWNESTGWYSRPAAAPLRLLPAPARSSWYPIDITDLYNAWQAGRYPNYGIQLRPTSVNNEFDVFRSSDFADPSFRPMS